MAAENCPAIVRSGYAESIADQRVTVFIEIPVLLLLAWHSDKTGERRWHVAVPVGIGAVAFAVFASSEKIEANVVLGMVLLTIAIAGLHGYRASLWTLPTLFLSDVAAATGIGIINCFGNAWWISPGPYMVGALSNTTGSYRSGMLFLGGCH